LQLPVGKRFGPYEIVSAIGAGGMGEVYRARDTRLDRTVAIKVLNAALVATPDAKARFDREARAISRLNHPNICTLYDVGHEAGTDYLVMEYVDGETLADRLRRGPVPLQELVKIGSEIAAGLEAAHRAGIVHRDLKPGNVMLAKTGTKLLDFGLAKPAAMAAGAGTDPLVSAAVTLDGPSPQLSPLTSEGTIVGTIQYMSPQQIEGKEADARSDIFSFGSILYEMATGKHAFSGKSQLSVASAIMEKEPEPIATAKPALPPALDCVVRTCLAKNPEERYQSALDVQLQLRWIAQTAATAIPASRSSRSMLAVAGVCIAVTGVGWWLGARSSGPKPHPMHVTVPVVPGTLTGGTLNPSVTVSPDGHWLLYLVYRDGQDKLYIRAFSEAEGRILDGSNGARTPFFSPDSQWIGFVANGALKKLPVNGGSPITICNVTKSDDSLGFVGGTWAPDGRIVFVPGFNSGLWEVPASGGTAKLLLATDVAKDRVAATHPQVLPDGKGILFTSVPGKAKTSDDEDIAVLEPGSGEPRILFHGGSNARYLPTGYLVYGHTGSLMAVPFELAHLATTGPAVPVVKEVQGYPDALYSVAENGTLVYVPGMKVSNPRLYMVDRKGNRRPITDGSSEPEELAVSPDGKTVVARVAAANDDLWTFDTGRGNALRLTFEPGDEIYPQWTPDGKRVAYGSRTGTIYWRSADGRGQREELSHGEFARYPSSFSPDGKWLAIVEDTPTRGHDIWIIPIGGGDRKPIAFQTTDADEWAPKFSPDGRFVAYVSNESGTTEIYIRPFDGSSGRRRITSNGGQLPVWARNGRELFFVKGTALMSVGIDANGNASTSERPVLDPSTTGDSMDVNEPIYDVMPDGQHFVISLAPPSALPPHYEVIVNWFEEVKRLTAR
jgi:eukaryotic-like serine/threonine-protein kinase